MRAVVDRITEAAVAAVIVGGSSLDSPNLVIPVTLIVMGSTWMFLRILATKGVIR